MINPFEQINWKPEEKDLKSFAKSLFIGFIVIGTIIFAINCFKMPFQKALFLHGMFAVGGIVVFLISQMIPKILIPLYYPWFFISACIGIVVSNLILTMFFYLFFTPFAIGMKLLTGRDPLQLRRKTDAKSYWCTCRQNKDLSRYLKQY